MQIKLKLSTMLLVAALILSVAEFLVVDNYLMNLSQTPGWGGIPFAGIPWLISILCITVGIIVSEITEKKS